MPEFKNSDSVEQPENLATTADFKIRRRRRNPISSNVPSAAEKPLASKIGPCGCTGACDSVCERMQKGEEPKNSAESSPRRPSKYSTEVVGNPSPHRGKSFMFQKKTHGFSQGGCTCCAENSPKKSTKGIIRKVLGAIWPFKRSKNEVENTTQQEHPHAHRQSHGRGRRNFRGPGNKSGNSRSNSPIS